MFIVYSLFERYTHTIWYWEKSTTEDFDDMDFKCKLLKFNCLYYNL